MLKIIGRLILFPMLAALISCQSNAAPPPTNTPTVIVATVEQTKTADSTLPVVITATPLPPPTKTVAPTITASIVPEHYGPDRFPKGINPFTGLRVPDAAVLDRRPVMVKVSNFPPSGRPQFGLSSADLVFEHYIGEGMNRFSAIFYGQKPEKVGPVRSARLADIQLASMYQTIFGYASADPRVRNNLISELD